MRASMEPIAEDKTSVNGLYCLAQETMVASMDQMRVFVEVVRRGGFAGAGRALDMPRSTVSRWVRELETELGVRLLQRTTRKVELTEIGDGYFRRSVDVVDAAARAGAWAASQSARPQGTLVITTFHLFADSFLAPLLARYLDENPGTSAQVRLDERDLDLVAEQVDVAIRIGAQSDSSMVVRKLADLHVWLVASPDYVAKFGLPAHPRQLSDHKTVFYGHGRAPRSVHFHDGCEQADLQLTTRVSASSIALVRQLSLGGVGIGAVPPVLIHDDLAAGRLVRVLADWEHDGGEPIFVAYPSRSHLPPKVRAFVDLLAEVVTTESVNGYGA